MFQQVQVLSVEAPSHHRSHTRRWGGRPTRRKPGRKSLRRPVKGVGSVKGRQATLQVVAKAKQAVPKLKPPRETDLRGYWESVQNAEPISSGLRPQPSTKSWAGAVGGAPGSSRMTCREGTANESPEPLAGRLGVERLGAQRGHRV